MKATIIAAVVVTTPAAIRARVDVPSGVKVFSTGQVDSKSGAELPKPWRVQVDDVELLAQELELVEWEPGGAS